MPETPNITDEEIITRFKADFEGTAEMDEKSILFGQELSPADLIRHMREKTEIGAAWINTIREQMEEDLLQASKTDS